MPIHPLPQFEADLKALEEEDRAAYDALKPPRTIVVRFGFMKLVGEFPYDGDAKPGCGSKIVVRTHRGTEIGEMLTSTCPNSGCSKSVSRKEMLEYIDNSGGKEYPFFTEGRAVRVANVDDLNAQARIEQHKNELRIVAKRHAEHLQLPLKIVEIEPLFGRERVIVHYSSEVHPDLRELARRLGEEFQNRLDFHRVGARDEARLTADYERCGQYCCCKNFLKVLKPVSMKSAKMQKATLDPLKISGRCGRLMCCLRYEDETYEDLSKRLPRRKSRVGTPEGDGTVIDGQILTQLVLVRLDQPNPDGSPKDVAIPVENLAAPKSATPPPPVEFTRPGPSRREPGRRPPARQDARPAAPPPRPARAPEPPQGGSLPSGADGPSAGDEPRGPDGRPGRRRRRRNRRRPGGPPGPGGPPAPPSADS